MSEMVSSALNAVHPQMLRVPSPVDPQKLGEQFRSEQGQAFEWALDKQRLTKKAAADGMGYTDQGVIGRWISGAERVQLDKVRLLGDDVYVEFLLTLLQACKGVEVKTQVTLARVG